MRRFLALAALFVLVGCHSSSRDPRTVVFLIESSPANLDPRIGTDGQSERIDALLFDGLVDHNASFQFVPALATSWDQPDSLTFVFHLRSGVHFHDGRVFGARDVKWTIDSIRPAGSELVVSEYGCGSQPVVNQRDSRTVWKL